MKYAFRILLILLTAFAISCHDFDFEKARGETARKQLKEEYTTSFIETFGYYGVLSIDPEHTWGFDDITPNDTVEETRVVMTNSNHWNGNPYFLKVPKPLTQRQKDYVTHWFETTKNPSGLAVNWTDYFVQQVSSSKYGRHMDAIYDNGGMMTGIGSENPKHQWKDNIILIQGQSTRSFSYHETVSSKTWKDHYVIVPGELIDPSDELSNVGESIHGMFFLGFDYEAFKFKGSPDNVERDWFFNDWIIKITPAIPH